VAFDMRSLKYSGLKRINFFGGFFLNVYSSTRGSSLCCIQFVRMRACAHSAL
jgi:hypothetical protein